MKKVNINLVRARKSIMFSLIPLLLSFAAMADDLTQVASKEFRIICREDQDIIVTVPAGSKIALGCPDEVIINRNGQKAADVLRLDSINDNGSCILRNTYKSVSCDPGQK